MMKQLIIILYVLLLVLLGSATFVEHSRGSSGCLCIYITRNGFVRCGLC